MIRNINEKLGDPVVFASLDEMTEAVLACGYLPEDGLVEGRDYEEVREDGDGNASSYLVRDAEDDTTIGTPSSELVAESLAVDTGCVPARYDPISGVWEYVLPSQAGSDARTVYVRRI